MNALQGASVATAAVATPRATGDDQVQATVHFEGGVSKDKKMRTDATLYKSGKFIVST